MTWIVRSLWDLLSRPKPPLSREKAPRVKPPPDKVSAITQDAVLPRQTSGTGDVSGSAMQDRYDRLVLEMKQRFSLRIRKWRSSTSGCAWQVCYRDGSVTKLIESPYPKGPISCAIFLHEVGHHAIGFGVHRPRCLEEYLAWQWSLKTMNELGFNVTNSVKKRRDDALRYAVYKARKRGIKRLPVELMPFG